MANQFEKNLHQKMFFEFIRKLTSENQSLVDAVSNLLNISIDAAYRRIRCEKLLDFEELIILCNHFKISVDSLLNINDGNDIRCRYTPLDLRDRKNYLTYMQNLSDNIESVSTAPDGALLLAAADIPVFHYVDHKELIFFMLFAWNVSVYGYTAYYDEFVQQWDCNEASQYYEKIFQTYQHCPSTEIWTDYTIDKTLRLLSYHYEMGHFNDKNIPVLLCEQLLNMIDTIHNQTEKGVKGAKETSFKFYVSETDLYSNLALFKKNGTTNCTLRLFTINHFYISDQRFCIETEKWLNAAIQRSTLISGSSEKQRHQFFNGQKQKIFELRGKILKNSKRKRGQVAIS